MYAVVSSGGKQYRVEPGSTLIVERLAEESGTTIKFDRVLLVGDGDAITVGTPTVSGATVSGTVLGEELGPKIIIFKFKQKVKYRRRTGHRQHLTRVRIDEISANGKTASVEAPVAKAKPKRARASKPATAAAAKPARAKPKPKTARTANLKPAAAGSTRPTAAAAKKRAAADTSGPAAKPAPTRRSAPAKTTKPKE